MDTVLERYIVRCSESGLSIEKNGGTHACVYVFGDTFACDLGAVIFIRMHQKIVGVRVGSSTTHNKRWTTMSFHIVVYVYNV